MTDEDEDEEQEGDEMDERATRNGDGYEGRPVIEDRGWWAADDFIVASGDRHDRGVEYLCVGEAA